MKTYLIQTDITIDDIVYDVWVRQIEHEDGSKELDDIWIHKEEKEIL